MKNTPPHVKLSLPDGSRLTVEFNRERQAGENICIGVYQPDVDDTVYYEPYRVKGGQL